MSLEGESRFFAYARERYSILLRKQEDELAARTGDGPQGPPWTDDPILQQYRFCNVFREDDRVTQYLKHNVRDRYADHPLLAQAVIIARWFNRIEILALLQDCEDMLIHWNSDEVRRRLEGVSPIVTGAYMIKTPGGMSKLEGLIWCIEHIVGQRLVQGLPVSIESKAGELLKHGGSLEEMTRWLQQFPYLGAFMAYEVVTDLRHTPLLDKAPDIMTWANPGPGAMRGYGRVASGDPDHYSRGNRVDVDMVIQGMRDLLRHSRNERNWSSDWPTWEMRDVEHTLCEFDKYERARLGEGTPKQRYNGGLRR